LRILKDPTSGKMKPETDSFTHHDPLEDTERHDSDLLLVITSLVSPITIRLRILKGNTRGLAPTPPE